MERDEIEKILDKIDASKIMDVKVKEELEKSFIPLNASTPAANVFIIATAVSSAFTCSNCFLPSSSEILPVSICDLILLSQASATIPIISDVELTKDLILFFLSSNTLASSSCCSLNFLK